MLDILIASSAMAALAGIVELVKPLFRDFLARYAGQYVKMKIMVKSPDGTSKELMIDNPATNALTEDQLKQILKLLSEAENGPAETENPKH